jgi:uncharacterized protein (DUF1810 family)
MTRADPFDLERFVTAQAPVFSAVLTELHAGRKRTHWMWFVFPQLGGLGRSSMATFSGIASLHEARAYLGHPLLGPRLDLCTRIVLELEAGSLHEIFGSPDDLKFQSSMTLFEPTSVFYRALDRWCGGALDPQTVKLLEAGGKPGSARGHLTDRPRDCNPPAGRRNRVGPVRWGFPPATQKGRSRMRRSPDHARARSSIHQPPAKIGISDVR